MMMMIIALLLLFVGANGFVSPQGKQVMRAAAEAIKKRDRSTLPLSFTSPFVGARRLVQTSLLDKSINSVEGEEEVAEFDLKAWFNPNTRGGVIVWSLLLLAAPVAVYQYYVSTGIEPTKVGGYVGALFVLLSNLLWASTYIFRVANKDMTYAKQLKDYENAVLQKRLDELADGEIEALMMEIELEDEKDKKLNS